MIAARERRRSKMLRKKHQTSRTLPLENIAIKRRRVASDALAWKDATTSARLDDYEGFFGLEEVDDVEVVRDVSGGKVTFFPKTSSLPMTVEAPEPHDNDQATEPHHVLPEWNGFNDDEAFPNENFEQTVQSDSASSRHKHSVANGLTFEALSQEDDLGIDMKAWQPLKLLPDTLAALAKLNLPRPTAIQLAAIPEILSGHDVIGKASTGSGKTLAFTIPILERFLELRSSSHRTTGRELPKSPLSLILSPTRELAHQLDRHINALCSTGIFEGPRIVTLTGGLSVHKQQRLLKDADIIIGTPGRLWEIISSEQGVSSAIRAIEFLVIDEADRLLSEGHFLEVESILDALDGRDDDEPHHESGNALGSKRQTLVFSATFDRGLQKKLSGKRNQGGDLMSSKESMNYLLQKLNFREDKPKLIDVNPVNQLATGLKEGLMECRGPEKDLYLYMLLLMHPNIRTLVFTNSISAVRRLTPFLQNLELPASPLHSDMPQKARLRSVERFSYSDDSKERLPTILVATDVAARGLDIPNVQLIIHYHLPRAADTYVHRSGRTARAGHQGSSILICAPDEVAGVRRLVAKVHAQSAVAQNHSGKDAEANQGYYMRTLDIDRRIVSRLKPRASLAKRLADMKAAKEKKHKEDDFMRAAAEELGVDPGSEEFQKQNSARRTRGSGRMKKEREAREISNAEASGIKAELKSLLRQRVDVGVSERYLTSGGVDVDELLRQQQSGKGKTSEFLGPAVLEHM